MLLAQFLMKLFKPETTNMLKKLLWHETQEQLLWV